MAVLTRREWSTDVWVSIPFQRGYILAETTMAHSYHIEYPVTWSSLPVGAFPLGMPSLPRGRRKGSPARNCCKNNCMQCYNKTNLKVMDLHLPSEWQNDLLPPYSTIDTYPTDSSRPKLHQSHLTYVFCLGIPFWPHWQDESGPQMCGSLFPFREDIFWQRQQWPIVITMNTGPVVTFESSTDNQWGLSPWNAIFAERGVQRRSSQKFVVSKIVCYVIIKLKSNGSSFTIRIAEWQLSR